MAVFREDSKIIKPLVSSLSHLALVKIAFPFLKKLSFMKLQEFYDAFIDIHLGITATLNDDRQKGHKEEVQKMLLLIPAHLRHSVFKTCVGIFFHVQEWMRNHQCINLESNVCCYHLRSNGSIDSIKTVKNLVSKEKFNIRERFHLACMYCLEESVVTLWKKMEESGENTNFELDHKFMTNFWVRWLNEGSRVPWIQAFKEYIDSPPVLLEGESLWCSPFFSLLPPKERENIIPYIEENRDFLLCLYAANKEEEVKILEINALSVLYLYMHYPHQSFFVELAEKIWDFLDIDSFYCVLDELWFREENVRDFDYRQLFLNFWRKSPVSLREGLKADTIRSDYIKSIFNKIRRKRKRIWIRNKGRLVRTPRTLSV